GERDRGLERREGSAGRRLPVPRPAFQRDRAENPEGERRKDREKRLQRQRRRQEEAAVVEEERIEEDDALARAGQRAEDREIPEEDEEQQRDVADELDEGAAERGEEPV